MLFQLKYLLYFTKFTLNIILNERGLEFGEVSFQVNSLDAIHPNSKVFEFNALASGSGRTAIAFVDYESSVAASSGDKVLSVILSAHIIWSCQCFWTHRCLQVSQSQISSLKLIKVLVQQKALEKDLHQIRPSLLSLRSYSNKLRLYSR